MADDDGTLGTEEGSSSRVNWRRGLRRVFWTASVVWWVGAAGWIAANAPSTPRRSEFEPQCFGSLNDRVAQLDCGSQPFYQPPHLSLIEPDADREQIEHDARRAWEQRRNEHTSCIAAADLAASARIRECDERQNSAVGQRAISEAHRQGLWGWTVQLLLAVAVAGAIPFLLATLLFSLWRLGRWVREGFRAQT